MDPWPELERFLTTFRFVEIVEAESSRTLYVLPADVGRAEWVVEQCGAEWRVKVKPHPWLPEKTWLLVDEQAIEAGCAETMQKLRHRPLFPEAGSWSALWPRRRWHGNL